jgi:DNA-binding protein H-NS
LTLNFNKYSHNMSSYTDLLAQKSALQKQAAELEKLIQDARRAERAGVIAQIKALLAEHGLTAEDLGQNPGAARPKKGANAGKSVAPKYKDVATGQTWSGRGLKPKWVAAAIANGKTLDDLKI